MTLVNTLLIITIYSAIIYFAILLFRLIFRKHVSPSMTYLIWFLLIARLLVPVTIDSGFSLITVPSVQSVVQPQDLQNAMPDNAVGADTSANNSALAENSGLYNENNSIKAAAIQPKKESNAPLPLLKADIPTILTTIWILGMILMLTHTLISTKKLHIKFLKDSVPIPDEWLDIAKKVKCELNVKYNVEIVLIRDFVSPALNASIKPTIVIPDSMCAQDGEMIEFALRHEITHLKRKDHLVCLLLTALRIIYWFNPVIWLASKQMKDDMEIACDRSAVSQLNIEKKKRYAVTVLNMYAQEKTRFALGMSLGNTRKKAERRVRGMFARKSSSRSAKVTAVILAAVMLLACFTTACQPVQGKTVIESGKGQTTFVSAPVADEQKPAQTLSASAEPTATPSISPKATTDPNNWRAKFADKFSTDGQVHQQSTDSKWTYQSANVSIDTEKHKDNGVVYFVTDIYVADIKYFKTAFGVDPDKLGQTQFVGDAMKNLNGIVGINGDNCMDNPVLIIRNGKYFNKYSSSASDELVMFNDGTMKVFSAKQFSFDDIKAQAPYQAWGFGPSLLDGNGQAKTTGFVSTQSVSGANNPRTAIGYYEPGHYCFVVVDGRQQGYSYPGYSFAQMSQLMNKLGCKIAFNLDGGGTSQLAFNGVRINQPPPETCRKASDFIYITDEE